jgi:outer membrane protein TolC
MPFHKLLIGTLILATLAGCRVNNYDEFKLTDSRYSSNDLIQNLGTEFLKIEEPSLNQPMGEEQYAAPPKFDLNYDDPSSYLKITLSECIEYALQNSTVMRDLGGNVLRAPQLLNSTQDPALVYTDPRFGEEAALSAFDTNLTTSLIYDKNDRVFNNRFAGASGVFIQDVAQYNFGLAKRAATGSLFQFHHVVDYDNNNSPANRYNGAASQRSVSSAFDTYLEAEVRQPLLQGAGVTFNRTAGPNNQIGSNNGVLIARANTDISLAEFETGIRDLVSNVENTYWDLYYTYRDLEARIEARDGALKIWQTLSAQAGRKDVDASVIGQAEEQYFRFAADVENAIYGRMISGTQTNNGSSAGTFRSSGGVLISERRLRVLMGFNVNSEQILLPTDKPVQSPVKFDWDAIKNDALALRPELRKQRWQLKRNELDLIANRYYLLPKLDVVGKYRFRGFGHGLVAGDDSFDIADPFNQDTSAFADLLGGDRQEWQMGVEFSMPIGFRRASAAVRNSQLAVARQTAILREQERYVILGLTNAVGEIQRAEKVRAAQLNRLNAAEKQFEAILAKYRAQRTTIDLVLEAQRRVIDAKLQYFQTEVEYMLAIKAVHFEKGTLLDYYQINLTEASWAPRAYRDALERDSLKGAPMNYVTNDLIISAGSVPNPQSSLPAIDSVSSELFAPNSGMPETIPVEELPGAAKPVDQSPLTPVPMPIPLPQSAPDQPLPEVIPGKPNGTFQSFPDQDFPPAGRSALITPAQRTQVPVQVVPLQIPTSEFAPTLR